MGESVETLDEGLLVPNDDGGGDMRKLTPRQQTARAHQVVRFMKMTGVMASAMNGVMRWYHMIFPRDMKYDDGTPGVPAAFLTWLAYGNEDVGTYVVIQRLALRFLSRDYSEIIHSWLMFLESEEDVLNPVQQ